jgi:hypothetical protein
MSDSNTRAAPQTQIPKDEEEPAWNIPGVIIENNKAAARRLEPVQDEIQVELEDDGYDDDDIVDPENVCWPPRPQMSGYGDIYDKIKEFVLDRKSRELIFPTMDGNQRKVVHTVAELFGLPSKSYGKNTRHARVYKSEKEMPNSVQANNPNPIPKRKPLPFKDKSFPLFTKETLQSIRDEIISNVRVNFPEILIFRFSVS